MVSDSGIDGLMFRIKICGLTNTTDALAAVAYGADAIGLNFYLRSLRSVVPEEAIQICSQIKQQSGATVVGVFVNDSLDHVLQTVEKVKLDMIQLHGDQTPTLVQELSQQTTTPIIVAVRANSFDVPQSRQQVDDFVNAGATAILLDSVVKDAYGGTGQRIDWESVVTLRLQVPIILSGGLNPINVGIAIKSANPYAVDAASGIESIAGKKDHALMQPFIVRAQNAFAGVSNSEREDRFLPKNVPIEIEKCLASYELIVSQFEKQSCSHSSDFSSCCGSRDEYLNDIRCRGELQDLLARLPEEVSRQLRIRLEPLDNRLRALQTDRNILIREDLAEIYPEDEYFWYYGPLRGMG